MAKSTFKHQEDDGDLSVFASGDVVVLSCEHGHYWVLNAKQETSTSVLPAMEAVMPHADAQELFRAF